jgi:hypothetical protein
MDRRNVLRMLLAAPLAAGIAIGQDAPDEAKKNRLIVHEWGTFTSVLGADGTMLEWEPQIGSDLPKFVYDRATVKPTAAQRAMESKKDVRSFQRMETPVLYFYADREMAVDVQVGFPKGLITEWYPRVRDFGPLLGDGKSPVAVKDGFVRWGKVKIIPQELARPSLPTEGASNHYYYARETDAAYVRVCPTGDEYEKMEHEKFLFYRGVGNFGLPLSVTSGEGGRVTVSNPTQTAIGHVFVISIKADGKGKYAFFEQVAAGGSRETVLDTRENWLSKEMLVRRISEELEECLVQEGLYRKEAKSMVKTWTDSYFETEGTRVLYLLPQKMTDELLPLTLAPKPVELVRVLVARVDLMTPEQTKELVRALGSDTLESREKATKQLSKLGRFAEPALKEAIRTSADPEVRSRAKDLLAKLVVRR